ncbi:NAD(P)-binding protein [Rhizopus microsporus var. microsporus]|uniref:NAD(P)-binding protein n=2 Tax=Rhizopus microsporus TaxID=58291 RepID=A0A1X0R888_RHIZD|nr:NAD(P)-binding protein [Rhizopus microsporus var. microsporus]
MTIGFDEDLPNDVYHYNEMRKNMNWQKTGVASLLKPAPVTQHLPSFDAEGKPCFKPYRGSGKLEGKYALITGADSGIGRSIATLYALEGVAGITIVYRDEREDDDALYTKNTIEGQTNCKIHLIARDIGYEKNCQEILDSHLKTFGRIDILVNNAAEQHKVTRVEDLNCDVVERTFRTNVFGPIFMTKLVCNHLKAGGVIVNTASIAAYRGMDVLVDYSATKGAIVSFTRALSQQLAPRRIRVNAVAPGPVWTPLIPNTFSQEEIQNFGSFPPFKRPAQPCEVAAAFVFLASDDSSFITGQVVHPNGGTVINT